MKHCPGCGLAVGMSDDSISNGDATYHRACYSKLVDEMETAEPDPLERIADALERLADRYAKTHSAEEWEAILAEPAMPMVTSYDPLTKAERRG